VTLNMLHLPIELPTLFALGRRHGLVKDAWSVDLGYLVHALFAEMFGESAPKPFDIQDQRNAADQDKAAGPDESGRLLSVLAYAPIDHSTLAARAAIDQGAIVWHAARTRQMPAFDTGTRLGFRLRACPAVRVGKQHPRLAPGAEVDPYLALVQRNLAEAMRLAPTDSEKALRPAVLRETAAREVVYREWVEARVGAAATLEATRLTGLRDARLWRKGVPQTEPARTMHGRARASRDGRAVIGRREAVFEGTLRVADPALFAALLARGVGRHRAFGFGMLLLRAVKDDASC
jgi:CRISPR system Cascade subunit CasE